MPRNRFLLAILATVCLGVAGSGARAATFTVTTAANSGSGSLRQALADAGDGDLVVFDLTLPATITLTSGELAVDDDVEIQGPGADQLTVSGNDSSTVFVVDADATATISGLTISNGMATQGGGAIVYGEITLRHSTVSDNTSGNTGGIRP